MAKSLQQCVSLAPGSLASITSLLLTRLTAILLPIFLVRHLLISLGIRLIATALFPPKFVVVSLGRATPMSPKRTLVYPLSPVLHRLSMPIQVYPSEEEPRPRNSALLVGLEGLAAFMSSMAQAPLFVL